MLKLSASKKCRSQGHSVQGTGQILDRPDFFYKNILKTIFSSKKYQ